MTSKIQITPTGEVIFLGKSVGGSWPVWASDEDFDTTTWLKIEESGATQPEVDLFNYRYMVQTDNGDVIGSGGTALEDGTVLVQFELSVVDPGSVSSGRGSYTIPAVAGTKIKEDVGVILGEFYLQHLDGSDSFWFLGSIVSAGVEDYCYLYVFNQQDLTEGTNRLGTNYPVDISGSGFGDIISGSFQYPLHIFEEL